MSEKTFVDGMIVRQSKYSTKLSIKVEEFAKFVKEHAEEGWLNLEIKESKAGKLYACKDDWKPDNSKALDGQNVNKQKDDLPF